MSRDISFSISLNISANHDLVTSHSTDIFTPPYHTTPPISIPNKDILSCEIAGTTTDHSISVYAQPEHYLTLLSNYMHNYTPKIELPNVFVGTNVTIAVIFSFSI